MKKRLKITLKSDICIGSGYSYAGIVDADACFDRFGIPYIPARRIKGCLREAAELIGEKVSIFGKWGQKSAETDTPVYIADAYVDGYEEIVQALEKMSALDEVKTIFSPDSVRACYSRIKAQTEIEDASGTAKETSLRFTRIVNHYDPRNGKEMTFFAEIRLQDDDAGSVKILERAAKALRHMGENRTRGLGNVRCELLPDETSGRTVSVDEEGKKLLEGTGKVTLAYTVKTEAPVVVTAGNEQISETYINGRSVLGFFANAYLKKNKGEADEKFERLFLKNSVLFSPLYPADADGTAYTPAPAWINKLKKSGKLVNVSQTPPAEKDTTYGKDADNGAYYPGDGNQPKKLTGKFVSYTEDDACVHEVETELIYHHRHEHGTTDEQLYALNALKAGQYFSGTITGEAEDVKEMAQLLQQMPVRLGKSRSAQYGKCGVVSCRVRRAETEKRIFAKGDKLLVSLTSDGLFLDDKGSYTARTEEVSKQIQKSLEEILKEANGDVQGSFLGTTGEDGEGNKKELYAEIEVKQLSGYYGAWNLRRTSVPCVCAGSTFEFVALHDFVFPGDLVLTGSGNGEGFGRLTVVKNPGVWKVAVKDQSEKGKQDKPADTGTQDWKVPGVLQTLYRTSLKAELFREAERTALKFGEKASGLSASAVGRITLMLTESVNECNGKPEDVYSELKEKIKSIKDKAKKEEARRFVEKHYDGALKETKYQKLLDRVADKDMLACECKLHCLEQALVILKYRKKEAN